MSRAPDSICMLGHGPAVADFALRRIFRSKECDGSVVILDYQGRGAAILHESNAGNLPRRPLHWFDMADRVRPVSLFHLRHSDHFASVVGRLLANLRNILPSRIADSTLQWAVQAALQLSKEGTVGLGAVLKTVSDPAARRWFLDTQTDPEDLGRLLQLLHWALRFPAAYSASEGNNRADLAQSLKVPSTTWIEMPIEHFERCEHRIVSLLVEAALEDTLHGISAEKDPAGKPKSMVIPKPDGGQRRLGIACIRDRVVMSACLLLLDPVFDPAFSHFSFGFRPHRNAHQALAVTRSFIGTGATWAVTADIRKCFDCIDHDVLMNFVAKKIGDPAILDLIRHWLTVDVLDFGDIIPTEVGVPQGEAMSPLLANIYLDPLDKHFERLGLHFVRYADDITILTRSKEEAEKTLGSLADFLRNPLHLELKPAKTGYESVSKGFDILGFRLSGDGLEIQRTKMDRAVESLRGLMKILGDPKSTLQARSTAVFRFNAVVRGFRNYFLLPGERKLSEQMNYLDGRMEQMAYNYLPPTIRDDPAWICRERFCVPNGDDGTDDETEQQVQQVVGGYKFFSSKTSPDGWMVKSGLSGSPDRPDSRKAVLIDGHKPEDTTEVRHAETVVENAGRLYVPAHGSYLTMEGEDLVVKRRNVVIYRRSIDNLGLLFLQGMAMNISVGLQVKLAEMDIPVVFAPPVGTPVAILNPIKTPRSFLRALQVLRRDDVDVMKTGLDLLSAKVGNQAAVLRYFAKYRKNANALLGRSLVEAADEIKTLSAQINGLDPSDASVRTAGMGYEGRAAAVYWKQIAKLVSGELSFEGRVTRKATDVVNQSLNYVYGMLYGEVWRAIVKVGLDPYFGIVHGSERNQGGLVFDLIEEFRAPFADRIIFGMFGRGFIPEIGGHGFLKTRSKRRLAYGFAKRWSKKISWRSRELSPAEILEKQAAAFAMLMKREERYHPFRMRW